MCDLSLNYLSLFIVFVTQASSKQYSSNWIEITFKQFLFVPPKRSVGELF